MKLKDISGLLPEGQKKLYDPYHTLDPLGMKELVRNAKNTLLSDIGEKEIYIDAEKLDRVVREWYEDGYRFFDHNNIQDLVQAISKADIIKVVEK